MAKHRALGPPNGPRGPYPVALPSQDGLVVYAETAGEARMLESMERIISRGKARPTECAIDAVVRENAGLLRRLAEHDRGHS